MHPCTGTDRIGGQYRVETSSAEVRRALPLRPKRIGDELDPVTGVLRYRKEGLPLRTFLREILNKKRKACGLWQESTPRFPGRDYPPGFIITRECEFVQASHTKIAKIFVLLSAEKNRYYLLPRFLPLFTGKKLVNAAGSSAYLYRVSSRL
jgi:hypothetical protein